MCQWDSNVFARQLKSIINNNNPQSEDKLNTEQLSGVVYDIKCNDCHGEYPGKTIRQMSRRTNEHEKDVDKAMIFLTRDLYQNKNKRNAKKQIIKPQSQVNLRRSDRVAKRNVSSVVSTQLPPVQEEFKPKSALGKHVIKAGHSIGFKNISIVERDNNRYRLLVKESLAIRSKGPIFN
ncbi:unnamed protein product, partial [Didymodactylos carnosus]